LAFFLVLTSLPASAGTTGTSDAAEAPSGDASPTAVTTPAATPEQPTLQEMLARTPRADFAAGERPSTVTLAPAQEAAPAPAPAPEKKSHKTLWIVLGCVAGAALIWAIADSGGSSNGGSGGGGY